MNPGTSGTQQEWHIIAAICHSISSPLIQLLWLGCGKPCIMYMLSVCIPVSPKGGLAWGPSRGLLHGY